MNKKKRWEDQEKKRRERKREKGKKDVWQISY